MAIDGEDDVAQSLYSKAIQFRVLGNLEEEAKLLDLAVSAAPHDAGIHNELGRAQLALNRPQEAVRALRRAAQLNPTLLTVRARLGMGLRLLGRHNEAETEYRRALSIDRLHAPAHQELGELFRQCGRLAEAQQSFEAALRIDPELVPARIGLAETLFDQGEFVRAVELYRAAIVAGPVTASVYINLGIALKEIGDVEGSLKVFAWQVKTNPGSAEAHISLASALLECARYDEALASAREAIRLRVDFVPAHIVLGMIFAARGDWNAALGSVARGIAPHSTTQQVFSELTGRLMNIGLYERVLEGFKILLEREPDDVGAQHFVAALSGLNPDHPDEEYVRKLFDQYADKFDRHLQASLNYSVPQDIVAGLREFECRPAPWDALDLGCGTGLVGVEIAAHTRRLIGVDLSPRMIETARRHNVYTELKLANLSDLLNKEPPASHDVITAADVLIYVGKLDSVVEAISRALRPEGMFAFSAEAVEFLPIKSPSAVTCGYWLTPVGRYAHTEAYLRDLASCNHFEIKCLRRVRLRTERRRPVWGWLSIWTAHSRS